MDNQIPWYESNLAWGPGALGAGILLTVMGEMKHDLRWLLLGAGLCFIFASWAIARRWRKGSSLALSVVISALLICAGLYWMNWWLGKPEARHPEVAATVQLAVQESPKPETPKTPQGESSKIVHRKVKHNPVSPTVTQQSNGDQSPNSNFSGTLNQTGTCDTFQQGSNNTSICDPDEPTFSLSTVSRNVPTRDGFYETRFDLKVKTKRAILIDFEASAPTLTGGLVVWRKAAAGGESEFDDTDLRDMAPAANGIATVKLPDAETGDYIVIAHSTKPDQIVVAYK